MLRQVLSFVQQCGGQIAATMQAGYARGFKLYPSVCVCVRQARLLLSFRTSYLISSYIEFVLRVTLAGKVGRIAATVQDHGGNVDLLPSVDLPIVLDIRLFSARLSPSIPVAFYTVDIPQCSDRRCRLCSSVGHRLRQPCRLLRT